MKNERELHPQSREPHLVRNANPASVLRARPLAKRSFIYAGIGADCLVVAKCNLLQMLRRGQGGTAATFPRNQTFRATAKTSPIHGIAGNRC